MKKTKQQLQPLYANFERPNEQAFYDWMDSYWHKDELIPIESIQNLQSKLDELGNKNFDDVYVKKDDPRLTDSRNAKDVHTWAKQSEKPTYQWSEIQNTPQFLTKQQIESLLLNKVDVQSGKQLSTNDYTNDEKTKNESNYQKQIIQFVVVGDKNKKAILTFRDGETLQAPFEDLGGVEGDISVNTIEFDISTGIFRAVKTNNQAVQTLIDGRYSLLNHNHDDVYVKTDDSRLSDARNAKDVFSWAKQPDKPLYNWSEIQNKPSLDFLPLTGGVVNGDVASNNFIKKNSSNEKVLLGGGGEKELSQLENKSIIVGGRNYLLNSKERKKITPTSSGWVVDYELSINLEVGETYILSYKSYGENFRPFLWSDSGSWDRAQEIFNGVPFKAKENFKILNFHTTELNKLYDFELVKLERGNKATDWTPAPEDFDFYKEQVDFSELETFKNRPAGCWGIRLGGGGGIYVNFPANSSASSLEFFKPNWYPATRIGVRNSVDSSRFNDDNGKFRDLAWYDDVLRAGVECTQNTTLQKVHQNQTLFVTVPCNIELNTIDDLSSVSFRKVFDSGVVSFSCNGKNIIYTADNQFNGKKGSTAVISRYGNDCYIDIRNI